MPRRPSMARTRGSRTPRNWAEHQDRHRAGCEPAPAILSSGQSVQRSKIAYGISSHVTVALLPSCKGAGFEAPPIPLAIQSHWMNSSTADERAGPSGVAPMSVGGTKRSCRGGRGISGAEGRPAAPSTWRRQPPLTQSCPPCLELRTAERVEGHHSKSRALSALRTESGRLD
jgi:hypothetical protein